MGTRTSRPLPIVHGHRSLAAVSSCGRKRKAERDEDEEDVTSPTKMRKVRIPETGNFIYETLFKGGFGSDVIVKAVGREWRLHRHYLKQSPFFHALFSGGWKDSEAADVSLVIVDSQVTVEGLDIALGSMYSGEVTISTEDVVSVAGACRILQLESLLAKCGDIMMQGICCDTVVEYFKAGDEYGIPEVRHAALKWLSYNCLPVDEKDLERSFKLLRMIPTYAMELALSDPDTLVAPCELFAYSVICCWIYMRLTNVPEKALSDTDKLMNIAAEYFSKREGPAFILTSEGGPFAGVLKCVKLNQLVMYPSDLACLRRDNIFDEASIRAAIASQWERQLHLAVPRMSLLSGAVIAQAVGPYGEPVFSHWSPDANGVEPWLTMDSSAFNKESCRFGKRLLNPHSWRWASYMFGVKLTMRVFAHAMEMTYQDDLAIESMLDAVEGQNRRDSRFLAYRLRLFHWKDRGLELLADTGIKAEELFNRERCVIWEPRHFERKPNFVFPSLVAVDLVVCRREELKLKDNPGPYPRSNFA